MNSSLFHLGIALLAGCLLAYELLLLRLFKISQGSEFTEIALSIALLGFGASGTLLALARRFARRHARALAVACAPLAGLAMLGAYFIGQSVPFRPEFLVWGGSHVWHLLLWTLPLVGPFLIGAVGLGVVFIRWPRHTRSLYGFNMLGSGLGAIGLYFLLYLVRPEDGILLIASLTALAGALMALRWRGRWTLGCIVLFIAGLIALDTRPMPEVRISDTRDLWQLRQLPDARTVATYHGPDGRVDLIASEHFHHFPGQSLTHAPPPLAQLAICLDGSLSGSLVTEDLAAQFTRELRLNNLSALGEGGVRRFQILHLRPNQPGLDDRFHGTPWAAIPSSGNGWLMLNVSDAVDLRRTSQPSRRYPDLTFTVSSRALSDVIRSGIRPHAAGIEGPLHVESLAHLRSIDESNSVIVSIARGSPPLDPDFLHTFEGLDAGIADVRDAGIFTLSTSVDHPPRASLRLIALGAQSLRSSVDSAPGEHLLAIRGFSELAVSLMAVSLTPSTDMTAIQAFRLRDVASRYAFDLVWAPDISPEEVNQFNVLDEPIYYETARRIFAGEAEEVYREYPFDLRPPTEWWPFFWQPFKPATVWGLLTGRRPAGLETIPEANAVLSLIYQLRALTAAAIVLILLPLIAIRRRMTRGRISRVDVVLYFVGLGVGYMMLEILMIFMARRVLGTPVLAAAVVVGGMLVASGLGSLGARRPRGLFALIIALALAAVGGLEVMAHRGVWLPLPLRVAAVIAALMPMAYLMGMPFPRGLAAVGARSPAAVPWAWGINGVASVVAAPLALLFAITGGYQVVLAGGLGAYALAGAAAPKTAQGFRGS